MSESGGMLDAYLICQALGWEWNLTSMLLLTVAPILIIGGIILFVFKGIPFICDLLDK